VSIQILADSKNDSTRATTILFQEFPYCLLQEINTHRTLNRLQVQDIFSNFSRNSASTRAIKNLTERVTHDPFIPQWEREKKGMSGVQDFSDDEIEYFDREWISDCKTIAGMVEKYQGLGIHKSKVNRLLAPFLVVPTVITATDFYWDNFFNLRCDSSADSDFSKIARQAKRVYDKSEPFYTAKGWLHLPLGTNKQWTEITLEIQEIVTRLAKLSFDAMMDELTDEYIKKFFNRLVNDKHWSPLEHILLSADDADYRNTRGWMSLRMLVELGLAK
jgi:hypothetical protein